MEAILEVEEDPIIKWRGHEAWEAFPDSMIPCPLSPEDLSRWYSMEIVPSHVDTSLYNSQIDKLRETMEDTPINKTHKASKRPRMASYAQPTIDTRIKSLGQFIGFCYHHLHLTPTLEHVMDAQKVAKYWGFLKAKDLQVSGGIDVLAISVSFMCGPSHGLLPLLAGHNYSHQGATPL